MAQREKLRRQSRLDAPGRALQPRVHASRISLEGGTAGIGQSCKGALGRTGEVQRAHEDVGPQRLLAEYLGQAPLPRAPQQLHLPQAVLSMHSAKRGMNVVERCADDVRHAFAVPNDFNAGIQPLQLEIARVGRHSRPPDQPHRSDTCDGRAKHGRQRDGGPSARPPAHTCSRSVRKMPPYIRSITMLPEASASIRQPGGTTHVASYSSTIRGPDRAAFRSDLRATGVASQPCSSPK